LEVVLRTRNASICKKNEVDSSSSPLLRLSKNYLKTAYNDTFDLAGAQKRIRARTNQS
jgi:hypothetical protein